MRKQNWGLTSDRHAGVRVGNGPDVCIWAKAKAGNAPPVQAKRASPRPDGGRASDPADGGFADRRFPPTKTDAGKAVVDRGDARSAPARTWPRLRLDQKFFDSVTPYVRGSPGCPTISPVLPDWVDSNSK